MSLNTLIPFDDGTKTEGQISKNTRLISGPVTVGDSPTYTTQLRGRTFMKDVKSIETLDHIVYQPQVVTSYGPNKEQFSVPQTSSTSKYSSTMGGAGFVTTLVDIDGTGIPRPKWIPSTDAIAGSSGSAFFFMAAYNTTGTTNLTSTSNFDGRKMIINDQLPFARSETYEIHSVGPFLTLYAGTYASANIILESDVASKYQNDSQAWLYQNLRRWSVKACHIYDLNPTGNPLYPTVGTFEHTLGEITNYLWSDEANGTYNLNIKWQTRNAGETIMSLILHRTADTFNATRPQRPLLTNEYNFNPTGNPFRTVWNLVAGNETITLPLSSSTPSSYNFMVDWGDGSPMEGPYTSKNYLPTHTYAEAADTYVTVNIYGKLWGWRSPVVASTARLIDISQWGSSFKMRDGDNGNQFSDMNYLRSVSALDAPDVSELTFADGMFAGAGQSNNPLGVTGFPGLALWEFSPSKCSMNAMFGASRTTFQFPPNLFRQASSLAGFLADSVSSTNGGTGMTDCIAYDCSAAFFFSSAQSNGYAHPTFIRPTNLQGYGNFAGAKNFSLNGWSCGSTPNKSNMFTVNFYFNNGNTGMAEDFVASGTTDISSMFQLNAFNNGDDPGVARTNSSMAKWDTSTVVNMSLALSPYGGGPGPFNQELFPPSGASGSSPGYWKLNSVTNMGKMFYTNTTFNNGMTAATGMSNPFIIDVSMRNVSLNMGEMFAGDGNVTFRGAGVVDPILLMPTGFGASVNVNDMFRYAPYFDSDLGYVEMSRVTSGFNSFIGTNWSQTNFDSTMVGWGVTQLATIRPEQFVYVTGLGFDYNTLSSMGQTGVYNLKYTKSWTFTGLANTP